MSAKAIRLPRRAGAALAAALLGWWAAPPAHAATVTVTTAADAGPGSLRDAVDQANGDGEPTLIDFAPGLAGQAIALAGPLPPLVEADTTLDGDLGGDCVPDVGLDGGGAVETGLELNGTGGTVRGLAVYGFAGRGIVVSGDGNAVECSYVGTDLGLSDAVGNGGNGVELSDSSGNRVGPGNLIAARLRLEISCPGSATLTTAAGPCPAAQPGLCGELFQLRVAAVGNRVTANAIRDNGGLGIALSCCCGPVPNDPGDADVGPNGLLNHPELATLTSAGGGAYTLSGTAPPDSTVEVFEVDPDPSGAGEGAALVASTVAGPGGAFAATFPLAAGFGELTATATAPAPDLSTSELAPNLAFGGAADEVNLGAPGSFVPGASFSVPVRVRDLSLTPLGVDRPAGERIQAMVIKVGYPPAAVAAIGFSRAGITLPLTPIFETTVSTAASVSWVVSFDESTDPIPFTLDSPFPGDLVADLDVTLAADAPAGPVALTLDAAVTELGNQAGTLAESPAGGTLLLGDGGFEVLSNAASGLYAAPQSSSEIALGWSDPQRNETGFRLERSPDGASWAPVATLGPDDTSLLDFGLPAATLHYYRLVTLIAAGDSQTSQVAAASTFAAAAAQVCVSPIDAELSWARFPNPAFDGSRWGVAWQERPPGGGTDQVFFRRLHQGSAAPAGPPLAMTDTDSSSALATLRWNGSRYGLLRVESLRGEPGEENASKLFFSLLEADGTPVRRDVRPFGDTLRFFTTSSRDLPLVWDGTHWSLLTTDVFDEPFTDLVFARLDEDGDPVLGPLRLSADLRFKLELAADWSPAESKVGAVYVDLLDTGWDVYFQRIEESTGVAEPPVLLASYGSYFGSFGTDVAWTGGGWAAAWAETLADFSESRIWLQLLAPDGTPLGPPERLSDDPSPGAFIDDSVPSIHNRTGGGFVVVAGSFDDTTGLAYEISRLQADAAGARDGARELLSPLDGRHSFFPRVASDGGQLLTVYNDNGQGTLEIAALLSDAAGMAPPAAPVELTSGHSPGNGLFYKSSFGQQVAPLGAGFVALWVETSTEPATLHARIFDGAGAVIATPAPLSTRPAAGAPGLAAVGEELATAWRDDGGAVVFQRFDAAGNPLTGESELSTSAGGRPEVALGFDGEAYAALWHQAGSMTFRRVAPDGTPLGPAVPVLGPFGVPGPRMRWTGVGWAVLFRQGSDLLYGLLDRHGGVLAGPVTVSSTTLPAVPINSYDLAYDGAGLGVAWSELRGGLDPPGREIFFTVLDLAGNEAFPEVVAVGTPLDDSQPSLSWDPASGHYRLVHLEGSTGALREIEIAPDGTVAPGERFLANRGGTAATAWNGATLGVVWQQLLRLHFETAACVDDPSPPPCPDLAAASQGGNVQLSWPAVDDPESGIWRYLLYRDGALLAENFSSNTGFADRGFVAGTTHVYEVRAMNGAFRESVGCTAVAFSTLAGDANGNGTLEVADIFYLINYLLAGGPPPAGDADANGDGAVTVGDIFYLINFFFGGGPAPVWSAATHRPAAAAGGAR